MSEKQSSPISPIKTCPNVTLVVLNPSKEVVGLVGGECAGLPASLAVASSEPNGPVTITCESFVQPGQVAYKITYEYLLAIKGSLSFLSWPRIQQLDVSIPSDAELYLVVSH
jgi:hypothetical protein